MTDSEDAEAEFQAVASKPTRVEASSGVPRTLMVIVPDMEHPDFDPFGELSVEAAPALIVYAHPDDVENVRNLVAMAQEFGS